MPVGIDTSVNDVGLLRRPLGDHHHPEEAFRNSCDELENGTIRPSVVGLDGRSWR